MKQLLMQPQVLLFLWRCLLAGFGFGVMASYEFLYLKGLGAPETLMGTALLMSVCTEIPAFTFQGTILKFMSAPALLNIALATTALRLAAYAALPGLGTTWAVLPVELLHGITFGIFFCTATVYSSKLAPPRLGATMQGMFQSTYGGVGAGLGGLVGGFLMDRLGGQGLFATAAGIVAAGGVLGLLADQAAAAVHKDKRGKAAESKVE
jgi:MFS family permease